MHYVLYIYIYMYMGILYTPMLAILLPQPMPYLKKKRTFFKEYRNGLLKVS